MLDWVNYTPVTLPANWTPIGPFIRTVSEKGKVVGFFKAVDARLGTASGWQVRVEGTGEIYTAGTKNADGTYAVKLLADVSDLAAAQRVASLQDITSWQAINAPSGGTYAYETGLFRRFIGRIGVLKQVGRLSFHVRQFDAAKPITGITLKVLSGSQTGTVLATKSITPALTTSVDTVVTFEFDADIANAEGADLWVDLDATGGSMGLYDTAGNGPAGTVYYSSTTGYPGTLSLSGTHSIWCLAEKRVLTQALSLSGEMETRIGSSPSVAANTASLAAIASVTPALSNVQISGPATVMENSTSTFSSWGSPVGIRAPFNYVGFSVDPWDVTAPVTEIRLRVRENDSAGAILHDVTQNVSLVAGGGAQLVEFYLTQTINSTVPLYLEYFANGKTGRQVIAVQYPTPTYGQARYGTTRSVTDTTLGPAGAQFNLFFKFGLTTTSKDVRPMSATKNAIDPHWQAALTVPSALWGVVGREMNVYYDNILHSPFPRSHFWFNMTNSLNRGKEQEERWTVTPTVAETSTTTFELSYGVQKIATKTVTVKIAAASAGANVTRKWLPIGDSATNASIYPKEVKTLFDADPAPMRVEIVGTNPGTATGYTDIKTEGYSGKTAAWLYSDPASPFTFDASGNATGTTFDFARYLSSTSQSMTAGDWATIHIGINDVFQLGDDISVQVRAQEMVTQINAMISNMQAAVPGLRVAILECIPPSASQDSFGESYGTNYNRARYRRNRDVMLPIIQAAFEGRTGSGVFYAAFGCALDTVNNMTRSPAAPVNSRNSNVTVQRQSNGVHPDIPGYYQMADALYAFFKCQE